MGLIFNLAMGWMCFLAVTLATVAVFHLIRILLGKDGL